MKKRLIRNIDIVLFALYEQGGAQKSIHTEDVAHQIFQYPMGRQRYKWERYEYPDKERILRELRRLKNRRGTPLVKGHANVGARKNRVDGWVLTPEGVDYVNQLEECLRSALQSDTSKMSIYSVEELERRISETKCFKIYAKDSTLASAEDHHFTDMLYCLPDAAIERISAAFNSLLANAKAAKVATIISFLEAARKRFSYLLVKRED